MDGEKEDVMKKQVGGAHYKNHKIQAWDIIDEHDLNFYEGNALKYILRNKGDRSEDLEKAIHYLEKEIVNLKSKTTPKVNYIWQWSRGVGKSISQYQWLYAELNLKGTVRVSLIDGENFIGKFNEFLEQHHGDELLAITYLPIEGGLQITLGEY